MDRNGQSASPRGLPPEGASLGFAAFALAHSECGDEASELRLDERSLIGWCRRCNDSRIFVVDEESRRKQPARTWSRKRGQDLDIYLSISRAQSVADYYEEKKADGHR